MIHAGFALGVLSEEAMETLSTLRELEEFEQEAS